MNSKMMDAVVQVRKGKVAQAFETRKVPVPRPAANEVLIRVDAFGLNYADGMAIRGQYRDAPPLPCVLGYDVCGTVVDKGQEVTAIAVGDRVTAMTRFGGYAQYAVTDQRAVVRIDAATSLTDALALATQAATAWYCTREACTVYAGERVIVTAAAGGVGSLILQLCKLHQAKVYGIVSTKEKEAIARALGADATLNRSKGDVFAQYEQLEGTKAIDVMFDSAGGSYIRKAMRNLAPGGRLVGYGGAQGNDAGNIFKLVSFALSFGFFHPAPFLLNSRSFTGVNMLRLADHKPALVQRCLAMASQLFREGLLRPLPGKVYPVTDLVTAHGDLMNGKVPGKIAIAW